MFAEIFQRQKNKVKECGLKTVNEVRASNFLTGGTNKFLATPLARTINGKRKFTDSLKYFDLFFSLETS